MMSYTALDIPTTSIDTIDVLATNVALMVNVPMENIHYDSISVVDALMNVPIIYY